MRFRLVFSIVKTSVVKPPDFKSKTQLRFQVVKQFIFNRTAHGSSENKAPDSDNHPKIFNTESLWRFLLELSRKDPSSAHKINANPYKAG